MNYKIGDMIEVSLSPKKGYSQKVPAVLGLIVDIDDTKTNFLNTAYYVLLIKSLNETKIWIELDNYKVKKLNT
jgi:hypothetical protein